MHRISRALVRVSAVRTGVLLPRASTPLASFSSFSHENKTFTGLLGIFGATAVVTASAVYCEEKSADAASTNRSFSQATTAAYEDRLRAFSTPDKLFRYFASVEINGVVYMRPDDFIRSLTPGQLQPKEYGLDSFERKAESFGLVTSPNPSNILFSHDQSGKLNEKGMGLISYSEYLFLLTALVIPQSQFKIAFTMFDIDGNGIVDLEEFSKVQSVLQKRTSTGKRIHSNGQQTVNKDALSHSHMLQTFFGSDGSKLLTFANFEKYILQVQDNVLHLEFLLCKDRQEKDQISEIGFAHMLLRYAKLAKEDRPAYYQRVKTAYPHDSKGVSFDEIRQLFHLLHSLDSLETALHMYALANVPVNQQEFKRAAKAVSGQVLSDRVVNFLFVLFDVDGDGALAEKEFIRIMKDAASRGLARPRDLGVSRGLQGFVDCVKLKIQEKSN